MTACLADNHFVMTTTTGGAARVLEWLELYHQTEWPELKVYLTSVTDHYATLTLSGPNSRKPLAEVTDIDLDKDAFPFMTWKEGQGRRGAGAGVPHLLHRRAELRGERPGRLRHGVLAKPSTARSTA